ncbi:hypothetical protein K1T35_46460 [Pseudonocardia sp. DSM 110487]|uniref:hypothetical protein n=1 Tax=Pseudonocardia sp. DSM 110487 TaxID=2865833 RepID=UPI001C6959FF|nr:hypothetical protein [Pseudonocardia sp. DSM 110487]QYN35650.1 hypothetical protein K1T35_46460 [Pseudonocardia sp. DSM 110487]
MTATDESERRLAEALQARATGAGGRGRTRAASRVRGRAGTSTGTALLLALLGGAALGTVLALVSLLAPGVLPPLG